MAQQEDEIPTSKEVWQVQTEEQLGLDIGEIDEVLEIFFQVR